MATQTTIYGSIIYVALLIFRYRSLAQILACFMEVPLIIALTDTCSAFEELHCSMDEMSGYGYWAMVLFIAAMIFFPLVKFEDQEEREMGSYGEEHMGNVQSIFQNSDIEKKTSVILGRQELDFTGFVCFTCPKCEETLSYEKEYLNSRDFLICPLCDTKIDLTNIKNV